MTMPDQIPLTSSALTFEPVVPEMCQVRQIKREAGDAFTLELYSPTPGRVFAFEPGQFNMVYAFGIGEAPLVITGNPARTNQLLHTLRPVGTVTAALKQLKRDGVVGVRGPFGTGWPLKEAAGKSLLVIASGMGLVALRPALYYLLAQRRNYAQVVLKLVTSEDTPLLFEQEIDRWAQKIEVKRFLGIDADLAHLADEALNFSELTVSPAESMVLIAAPESVEKVAITRLKKAGFASEQIYVWLERNMKCGVGLCGRCQLGPIFVCQDGPVARLDRIEPFLGKEEI